MTIYESLSLFKLQKMLKLGESLSRNALERRSRVCMARQPFASAEGIRYMVHRSTQPYQEKPGVKMGLPGRILWKTLLPNSMNPYNTCSRHTILGDLIKQKYYQLGLKEMKI